MCQESPGHLAPRDGLTVRPPVGEAISSCLRGARELQLAPLSCSATSAARSLVFFSMPSPSS